MAIYRNITQYEIPRLHETFNLTDGHVYRNLSKGESRIIENLPRIFNETDRQHRKEYEMQYLKSFFRIGKQTLDFKQTRFLFCFSASESLEITANYLRLNNLSLALIEPCFDNLADIFKRHRIQLESIPDRYLRSPGLKEFLITLKSDVICLVSPNNPTGISFTKKNFSALVDYCKRNHKLLILDASFRLYNDSKKVFDEYKILLDSQIQFIFIEDTGKTIPTKEMKLSVLAVHRSIFNPIYDIYTDFLLLVSPFVVRLLTAFFDYYLTNGCYEIRNTIKVNRKNLNQQLKGTILTPTETKFSSVAWCKIQKQTAFELKRSLDKGGLHVLAGNHFFWSDQTKGEQFVRIALAREPERFARAVERLGKICKRLRK